MNCFLFDHLPKNEAEHRITTGQCFEKTYPNNTIVQLPHNSIGVILKGALSVYKIHFSGKRIIVNTLKTSRVFGMADVFVPLKSHTAEWVAKEDLAVLIIEGDTLLKWLQSDSVLLKNYLSYVHGRLQFLNNRLDCFTDDCLSDRVQEALCDENLTGLSKTQLAEYLGISRATLYRILKKLR